jgi:hypothetical protein
MLWIMQDQEPLIKAISDVKEPTTNELRKAAMIETQLVGSSNDIEQRNGYKLVDLKNLFFRGPSQVSIP